MYQLAPPKDFVAESLARNRLGVAAVVYFVMAAAAPLTVIAGVVTTGYAVTGVLGIPAAFGVVGVVLAVFSVGFVAMSRHVANAGGLYAYVAAGLGRPAGVAAAWMALLAYNALQVGLYGAAGSAISPLLVQRFNVQVAWWVIAGVAWAIVAILGVMRVDLNGNVLAVLLLAEIAIIVVFDGVALANPAHDSISLAGFNPANLLVAGVGAALVMATLGFVGFEAAVTYSEESRDRRRTVPVATFTAVVAMSLLYAVSSWAVQVRVGTDNIVQASTSEGPGLMFGYLAFHLGDNVGTVGLVLFGTSLFAAMLSFHHTTARYTFALGREQVLPRRLGATARRSGAPMFGSLLQSLIGIAAIALYALQGWDPLVQMFFWLGVSGGFGVLLLLAGTSLAVLAYGVRHHIGGVWGSVVCPAVAFLALSIVVGLAVAKFHLLLDVPADSPARYLIPASYGVAAIVGVSWALYLRGSRPQVYQRIGLGAKAATASPFPGASGGQR